MAQEEGKTWQALRGGGGQGGPAGQDAAGAARLTVWEGHLLGAWRGTGKGLRRGAGRVSGLPWAWELKLLAAMQLDSGPAAHQMNQGGIAVLVMAKPEVSTSTRMPRAPKD